MLFSCTGRPPPHWSVLMIWEQSERGYSGVLLTFHQGLFALLLRGYDTHPLAWGGDLRLLLPQAVSSSSSPSFRLQAHAVEPAMLKGNQRQDHSHRAGSGPPRRPSGARRLPAPALISSATGKPRPGSASFSLSRPLAARRPATDSDANSQARPDSGLCPQATRRRRRRQGRPVRPYCPILRPLPQTRAMTYTLPNSASCRH